MIRKNLMLNIDKNQKSSILGNMLYPSKHWGQSYIAIGVGCLRFSDLICISAMSIVEFSCLFCNTKISEFFDMTKSWATFCCSGT